MSATGVMNSILLALSAAGSRMFRNNVALAVVGDPKVWVKHEHKVTVRPGDCIVRNARPLHAGLFKGSGDLIGPTPVVITPEMVGRTVAVFTSIEVKSGRGAMEEDQQKWDRFVRASGGISGEARTPEQAIEIIEAYRRGAK